MEGNIEYFIILKNRVAEEFLKENSATSTDISEWKGKDITNFQDSLLLKVKTQVSEKWFYTYFKNNNLTKIPRIDMLNILCEYAGYKDWANFLRELATPIVFDEIDINKKSNSFILENINSIPTNEPLDIKNNNKTIFTTFPNSKISRIGLFTLVISSIIVGLLFFLEILPLKYTYEFCFIDSDRNKPINTQLQITLLREGESPLHYETIDSGCFLIKLKDNKIKMVVNSPYYKQDTIYRTINSKYHSENVELQTDDYALMLYYFSHSKVDDWKKRRRELNKMIANNAIIYQVFGKESYGVDILSKEDFINKLTLPTSSLKNLNVIETEKKHNKIVKLKFEVTPNEN